MTDELLACMTACECRRQGHAWSMCADIEAVFLALASGRFNFGPPL